jgi:hypothetical protein
VNRNARQNLGVFNFRHPPFFTAIIDGVADFWKWRQHQNEFAVSFFDGAVV